MARTNYKFPRGRWEVEEYEPAPFDNGFTGMFFLKHIPENDALDSMGGPHYKAIEVATDDRAFVDKLIEKLNELTA